MMFNHPLYLHVRPHLRHLEEFGKDRIEQMSTAMQLKNNKVLYMHNLSRQETAVFMLVVENSLEELEPNYHSPVFDHFKIVGRNGKDGSLWYKGNTYYALYLEITFKELEDWYKQEQSS